MVGFHEIHGSSYVRCQISLCYDRLRLLKWKVYKCDTCGKAYRRENLLRSHRSWSHPHLLVDPVRFEKDQRIQR
jgi:hypothetical protein